MLRQDFTKEQEEQWDIYMRGFDEELRGITGCLLLDDNLLENAYLLGRLHAIVGDDCRSVDYLSYEQVFELIKNYKK